MNTGKRPPAPTATPVRDRIAAIAAEDRFTSGGLAHRVLSFGPPTGRDLVYVPGITTNAEAVHFIAAALPEFRFHVPDLRGRGGSDAAGPGRYTLGHYRDDLAALIAHLGVRAPVVVGHSLGARIVAAWAVDHPDAATEATVVLVDPPTSGPGRAPYPITRAAFLAQIDAARRGVTAEELRAHYPKWPPRELELRTELLGSCDRTAVSETHRGFEEEDFFPLWDRLSGDVTLVHGADSPMVPPSAVAELARRNPAVRLARVDGAAHMIPWENLPGFTAALRAATAAPAGASTSGTTEES
ncbi:alpha/beta hydrolase [Streptomyces sp. DSM 44917]|uniref:Alpha/beta hydrolase n=1 Tax=Streptomyces boetiae TaxID=3075541 RepID=A0ABU2L4I0_9ACTN|nr:alpha/beta hydrolase [Streptomyces sp. DSM 44917]MDT0306467.1 alpha/beta hydrolase [Streptomyces sp. DSM 44917]